MANVTLAESAVLSSPADVRDTIMEKVEQRLAGLFRDERANWRDLNPDSVEIIGCIADMVVSGGKRMRPAFCISGYLAAGGDPESPDIVDVAAALELLHTFALLHDDVMDASKLRRNEPTAHVLHADLHTQRSWKGDPRRYGEGVAMLAGNLAFVYANRLVASCSPPVQAIWDELCTELMVGQFLDIRAAARFRPDTELARWIALFKSGRYTVQRPLSLGAALAGDTGLLPAFAEYGLAVGEAFQLRDDLLDAFGDAEVTGKPVRLDFERHKMTLLMSYAIRDDATVAAEVGDDLSAVTPDRLYDLLVGAGIHDRVEAVIKECVEAAHTAVGGAGIDARWAAELSVMADAAAYRDR
ncbi:polyprenyl synthetase family protein [Streptomyces sp. NPDC001985]|uniref:polyprenyl synthetase family protein n=1 Tax=Streptomyces sp. NPDC001985 TaxID=3154406 RepID=UPI003316CDA4